MVLEITDETIDDITKSHGLTIIDFYADWCNPCKVVAPILDELSEEYKDQVTIGKLNIDENDHSVDYYGIRSIPTILFFKNYEVVGKINGVSTKEAFINKINNLMNI